MIKGYYTEEPRGISVFPLVGGKTDVTLRENITQKEEAYEDGATQIIWECDEISCRYDGRVSESQIRSNYGYWRRIFNAEHQTALEKAQAAKIAELSEACHNAITYGVDVLGGHYSLTVEDQLTIQSLQPGDEWHADGETGQVFDADMIAELWAVAHTHVQECQIRFNDLKHYVLNLTDIDAVKAITWETVV